MNIDFTLAPWGMAFAAFMYIIGNGTWMNHLARKNVWLGWILWSLSALLVVVGGAFIEQQFGNPESIWNILTHVEGEKHWIIVTLYALISIPAAASVLFKQSITWTRLAVITTTLIVFMPLGIQLQDPSNDRIPLSIGIALAISGTLWLWSAILDSEPKEVRKTVPVGEMDQ